MTDAAAVAIGASQLAGASSDRTTARFGRGQPPAAGGALPGAAALVALSRPSTVLGTSLTLATRSAR